MVTGSDARTIFSRREYRDGRKDLIATLEAIEADARDRINIGLAFRTCAERLRLGAAGVPWDPRDIATADDDMMLATRAIDMADALCTMTCALVEGRISAADRDALAAMVESERNRIDARHDDRYALVLAIRGAACLLRHGACPTNPKSSDDWAGAATWLFHGRGRETMTADDCAAAAREQIHTYDPSLSSRLQDEDIASAVASLSAPRARRGEPGRWEVLSRLVFKAKLGKLSAEALRVEIQGADARRRGRKA
jgi:hypothetical protein